jgi:electron transfer flavoprotein alpha subunit
MAEVLVVVDATGGAPKKVSLELLTLARTLGEPAAVVFGDAAPLDAKLKEYGAAKVYVADAPDIDKHLVAPKATVLASLVKEKQPAAVLLPSTQEGKEIAGRLAVKLDNGLLVDAVDVAADGTATQTVFAGSTIVKSKVTKGIPLITIRPNSVTPRPADSPGAAAAESVTVELSDTDKLATVTDRVAEKKGSRPELTEASIVVAGGRGVGSAENFKLVEEMADLLGGAGRRVPRGHRLRLLPAPVPGRADRQDGLAAAVHRAGHLGRDPAPGRNADLQDDHRREQGRRGSDLRTRRLRRRGRPVQGRPAGDGGDPQAEVGPHRRGTAGSTPAVLLCGYA